MELELPPLVVTLRGLLALSILIDIAIGCGPHAKRKQVRVPETGTEPSPQVTSPTPPDQVALPVPITAKETPDLPIEEFDESSVRLGGQHYYQWDARLKDLFSPTTSVSQLCWPAALAAEMDYRRSRVASPFNALPEVGSGDHKAPDEIRYFTRLCETDRDIGTTVIQGVRCIDKHLKASGLAPSIKVSGVDAQWQAFGLFPSGVTSSDGSIVPEILRHELQAGTSVLLLIGYYSRNAMSGALKRERGHFVAITGFAYRNEWGDERLDLHLMNPAVAPAGTAANDTYEAVELRKLPASANAPQDVKYELLGKGFGEGSRMALIESAVTF